MKFDKNRKLVLATGEKQFHWRNIHSQKWYKSLPFFYRDMFRFMIDKSDTGGVFDFQLLYNWQEENIEADKFQTSEEIFETFNRHRDLLRKLYDIDKKTGEEVWSGLVLLEDYYCMVCGHGTLNVNIHKSSYDKGIINSYTKHGIDFKTIRGLNAFNLKYKKKKKKASKGS